MKTAEPNVEHLQLAPGGVYITRGGETVEILREIKCGWFEVQFSDSKTNYYVDKFGFHRHNRDFDVVYPVMTRGSQIFRFVPPPAPTKPKKKKRYLRVGKYLVDAGDDVDTTKPITQRIGKWIKYGKRWKYSELDVTVVED